MSGSSKLKKAQQKNASLRRKRKPRHKCRVCKKCCKTEFSLKIHMRCHKRHSLSLYRCTRCHMIFTNKYVLKTHYSHAHFKLKSKCFPGRKANEYYCMCCRKKFNHLPNLKKHLEPTLSQFPSTLSKSLSATEKKPQKRRVGRPPKNSRLKPLPNVPLLNPSPINLNQNFSIPSKILPAPINPSNNKKKGGKNNVPSMSPMKVLLVPVDGKPLPVDIPMDLQQGASNTKKLATILPRPSGVPSSVKGPRPINLVMSQGQSISKNTKGSKRQRKSIFFGDQDGESDTSIGDNEFMNLLSAALLDDSSEDNDDDDDTDSDSSDSLSLSSDHRYAHGQDGSDSDEEDDSFVIVPDPVEDENMRQFILTHSSVDRTHGVFKCLPCRSAFSSDAKLLDHLNCHLCHVCGALFDEKQRLTVHLNEHDSCIDPQGKQSFSMKFDSTFIQNMFEKYTDICEDGQRFSCILCPKTFSQRASLFVHMYSHARYIPGVPSGRSRKISDTETNISPESRERSFPCPQCGKSFFSRNNLRGHMEIHEETHKYLCSICGKGFRRKRGMAKHLEVHSKEEKQLMGVPIDTTERVKTSRKTPESISAYKKQLPSNSGQFVVAACFTPKKLVPDQKLPVETRDRTYPCPICNKPFFTKHNVRGHMEVHKEKRHFCSICNQSFRRKLTMERHEATHTR